MKRVRQYIITLSILALNACTLTDYVENNTSQQGSPILFDTYLGGYGVTRGQASSGVLTLKGVETGGFGVFGYYHDGDNTSDGEYTATARPDFMFNTTVKKQSEKWTYSPIKYWPNETGSAGGSRHADRLSFQAYAPFTDEVYSAENKEPGVYLWSKNSDAGDVVLFYRAAPTDPTKSVDLVWATGTDGQPLLNLGKPNISERVSLQFHHALTQLAVDVSTSIHGGGTKEAKTKVLVESFKFLPKDHEALGIEGRLNLNKGKNENGWTVLKKFTAADGGEIKVATDLTYKTNALFAAQPQGVVSYDTDAEKQNLFGSGNALFFIPDDGTDKEYTVELKYHVMTDNTAGNDVTNEFTKDITLPFIRGNAYKLNIILGLTGVTFSVDEVDEWGTIIVHYSKERETWEVF